MNIDRIDKLGKIFETLSSIWYDDPHHLVRFLALMNEGMLFRRCIQFRCGVKEEGPEECKECPIDDITEIAPYLRRLYLGGWE